MKPTKHLLLPLLGCLLLGLGACIFKKSGDQPNATNTFSPSRHTSKASIIFGEDTFDEADSLGVLFQRKTNGLFDITLPYSPYGDSLRLQAIDLRAWVPLIPTWVQEDQFLTKAGIINQTKRQHQVEFTPSSFTFVGSTSPPSISQVDILHHCLYDDEWEVICYNQAQQTSYHLKFPFPEALFADLFMEKNDLPFEEFQHLIDSDFSLQNTPVILSLLRRVQAKEVLPFQQLDTLSADKDSIQYANLFSKLLPNFSCLPPKPLAPNPAVLVRKVEKREILTEGKHKTLELEIQLLSNRVEGRNKIIAGALDNIPMLKEEEAARGLLVPIGLYSPPCYESYQDMLVRTQKGNYQPYAFFINPQKRWLDFQDLGIDHLLLYYDQHQENQLHIKFLSLKRMKIIGDYLVYTAI